MSNIVVTMKSGEVRKFIHTGRPGGSWTKTLKYEGGFAVIEDEYQKRTAIPASDIREVVETPHNGYGW
jgi:hypothetical protein